MALQRDIDAEVVAVALFHRATDHEIVITRKWIEAELNRLKSHGPTCRCNEPCQLSHNVTAAKTHFVVKCWVRSSAATARLARR